MYLKEIDPLYFPEKIREIAIESLKLLNKDSPSWKEAKLRARRPVDYLRLAEFSISFQNLELRNGSKILDVGSPQWFTLVLAKSYPSIEFFYLNILKGEIDCVREIAKNLGIKNLHYVQGDVRNTCFKDLSFNTVISISVIEHISPEKGGDFLALKEIKRVLKGDGNLTISIPVKEKPRIIYMNGNVYERKGKKEFFAREYGLEEIMSLVDRLNFRIEKIDFIVEKKGFFALDYWRWGKGRRNLLRLPILGFLKFLEKMGLSLEGKLANRYLFTSNNLERGVIGAVLKLKNREK